MLIIIREPEERAEPVNWGLLIIQTICASLCVILSSLLLLAFVIRRNVNGTFYNALYANLTLCALLSSAVLRPLTVLQNLPTFVPPKAYCTTYVFGLEMETVTVPLALLMLTIERVLYLRSQGKRNSTDDAATIYRRWMSRCQKCVMILVPWIIGLLLAAVKTFGLLRPIGSPSAFPKAVALTDGVNPPELPEQDDAVEEEDEEQQHLYSCHLVGRSDMAHLVGQIILYTWRSGLPFCYLVIAGVLLLKAWSRLHHLRALDQGEDAFVVKVLEKRNKTRWSVGVTVFLCAVAVLVVAGGSALIRTRGWLDDTAQWIYFSFQATVVLLGCMTFSDVRHVWGCSCHGAEYDLEEERNRDDGEPDQVDCLTGPTAGSINPSRISHVNEICKHDSSDCCASLESAEQPSPTSASTDSSILSQQNLSGIDLS